ncbi:putative quinol monooxygenase [Kitasatospora sp. NPDC056138]|uniref:putative quinol monooxygenase n=1 Tax=Kitasatospora sp. NPDC056138 TaxID=3345724 RepID=UPI0035DB8CC0
MILIAELTAVPGQADRLRTLLEGMIEPSLEEPGCRSYQPLVDPNRPERMVIIEEWQDEEALQEHFATPHFRHASEVLDTILAEPLALRRLTPLEG